MTDNKDNLYQIYEFKIIVYVMKLKWIILIDIVPAENKQDELGTSITLPRSPLSLQLVSSWLIYVSLNPGGVSQSSQKVKSVINECVPLIRGGHVYL